MSGLLSNHTPQRIIFTHSSAIQLQITAQSSLVSQRRHSSTGGRRAAEDTVEQQQPRSKRTRTMAA